MPFRVILLSCAFLFVSLSPTSGLADEPAKPEITIQASFVLPHMREDERNLRSARSSSEQPRSSISDQDVDGIPDGADKCPDEPEDFDGFQDEDGCPEADNDLDGIPDSEDRCPNEPEDKDGNEDTDGCAEPQATSNEEVLTINGLMWQKTAAPNPMNWSSAKQHCENLSLGGYSDWRLPSISELRSIIRGCPKSRTGGACRVTDDCRSRSCWSPSDCFSCYLDNGPANGCYEPRGFNGKCPWLWSSSSDDTDDKAWIVGFNCGAVDCNNKINASYVRCVRGGQ